MMRSLLLPASFLFVLLFSARAARAQQAHEVAGTVTDAETGAPLPGVNVVVRGTTIGTATDADGQYSLTAPSAQDTLVFSFIGYEPGTVPIDGRATVDVPLSADVEALGAVIVVGYGEQSRETITTAVAKVDEAAFSHTPGGNPLKQLQGKVPGLSLQVSNGQPGNTPQLFIRGGTSTSPENDQPLIIVDGLVSQGTRAISDLNPEDITSVQVLKDAASTAIYGARAANGVIIIETRSGQQGKPQVSFSYTLGLERQAEAYDLLNAREYLYVTRQNLKLYNDENPELYLEGGTFGMSTGNPRNSANTAAFLDTYIEEYGQDYVDHLLNEEGWETMKDPATGRQLIFKNTNYQAVTFQPGYKQEVDLSVSGGTERATYYAGLGYMDQEGIVYGTFYNNYSALFNGTYQLSDKVSFDAKLSYQVRDIRGPQSIHEVLSRSVKMPPTYRLYYENGLPAPGTGLSSFRSRLHEVYYREKYADTKVYRTSLQGGVDWDVLPGLRFSSTLHWFTTEGVENRFEAYNETQKNRPASAHHGFNRHLQLDGLLEYDRQFLGVHNVNAVVGMSYLNDYSYQMNGSGYGAPTDYIPTLNATREETQEVTTTKSWDKMMSYFGRVNYDYDRRYLLSISLRMDGSSRFAAEHKWGYFPGVSVGWNVHREVFWQPFTPAISHLKLRASWGQAGNNPLTLYDSRGRYSTGYTYLGEVGILNTSLANRNLVWETTTSFDVGMDVGLFNDRVFLLLDYYNKVTEDRLFDKPLWASSGFSSIRSNYGSIRNRGFEVGLSATPIQTPDFTWDLSFTFAFNRQTIVELPENGEEKDRIGGNYVYDSESGEYVKVGGFAEGERFGGRWAYKMIGVYPTDEAAADAPCDMETNCREKVGGDAIWLDKDENGVIDHRDMVFMGYIRPDKRGGMVNTFSYKGLTLRFVVDYALGHVIDNGFRARANASARNDNNAVADVLSEDIWVHQGDQATIPRYTVRSDWDYDIMNHVRRSHGIGNSGYSSNSSLYYSDGDYLAFREVSLSYKLQAEFLSALSVQSMELSAGIYNLGYITAYNGLMPEIFTGHDPGLYPRPRQYNFGVQINF